MDARPVAGGVGSGHQPRPARDPGLVWIVCLKTTRDVAESQVLCPLGGRAPFDRCLHCRLLEAVEAEWRVRGCEVEPED